jgi:hypothetical protein
MIKYCLKKWDENKDDLELALQRYSNINCCDYLDLVKLVVKNILGDEWDAEKITEIDDGDYQGTLLFLIPMKTYQPSEYEYLATFVSYGSCSGCDTLLAIQDYLDKPATEKQIKCFMALCKDLVANMRKPFNNGWRSEPEFEEVVG